MGEPTLETFRKWLQIEIADAESLPESTEKNRRLIHLESALQEAMAFEAARELRMSAEIEVTQVESSVRLVSATPSEEIIQNNSEVCTNCGELMNSELEFCSSCGDFQ